MKKLISLLAILFLLSALQAKEGMWIPLLIKQYNESDMINMGMKITAQDLYDANNASIKDAICLFGGGCTSEIISSKGLLLTNHHCGYGQIQKHSSVENDFLSDGFWAMTMEEELPNPGLSVTFIVSIEDVSEVMLRNIPEGIMESDRNALLNSRMDSLKKEVSEESGFQAVVKPFYQGNQYFMFITETYEDIRLVGAPPSSIGKFGFDTDNWMWPRHNADFSMFRIYADKDNNPAKYSEDNVPYTPKHYLPINIAGVEEGDFSMVYGFPARTSEYLPSVAVAYIIDEQNPSRVEMRDVSLRIINEAMRADKKINIQYAAKQSRISNAWKKWKGQSAGLIKTHAVEKKEDFELAFAEKVNGNSQLKEKFGTILSDYQDIYKVYGDYATARDMLIEVYYYGPEILRFAQRFADIVENEAITDEEWKEMQTKWTRIMRKHFKDYNSEVDHKLFREMIPEYLVHINTSLAPQSVLDMYGHGDKNANKVTDQIFKKSVFTDSNKVRELIRMTPEKARKAVRNDPAYGFGKDILDNYKLKVQPEYDSLNVLLKGVNRQYMKAMLDVMPDAKVYYPDANFTLRITYGQVKSYEPVNGILYKYNTTLDGVIQKMDTSSYEFDVPQKLVDLYYDKDFGDYANADGTMPVCYIATNHTSGGNSGSPALDANGYLVGLNFDRTWESTMSDIMYDPAICRNIMVDIRYVLFIVDKFAGAQRLIDEMNIVKE